MSYRHFSVFLLTNGTSIGFPFFTSHFCFTFVLAVIFIKIYNIHVSVLTRSLVYQRPSTTQKPILDHLKYSSVMEPLAKTANSFKQLTIFAKSSIVDVWQDPTDVSARRSERETLKLLIECKNSLKLFFNFIWLVQTQLFSAKDSKNFTHSILVFTI